MPTPEPEFSDSSAQHDDGHAVAKPTTTDAAKVSARSAPPTVRPATAADATRTTRAVSWIGWYLPEVSSVVLPAAGAALLSSWLLLVSVLAALRWIVREVRVRHESARGVSGKDGKA